MDVSAKLCGTPKLNKRALPIRLRSKQQRERIIRGDELLRLKPNRGQKSALPALIDFGCSETYYRVCRRADQGIKQVMLIRAKNQMRVAEQQMCALCQKRTLVLIGN
jgi:hypothetical protein